MGAQAILAQALGRPEVVVLSGVLQLSFQLPAMLARVAARHGALARAVPKVACAPALSMRPAMVSHLRVGAVRFGSDYDWNLGTPGSRIKNPAPDVYNDVYPPMGRVWWSIIGLAIATWFWGNWYDT